MNPQNPEHLLGSYALGGLTDEEKERLFQAALQDQALFDELVREEKIKVALLDPENRAVLERAMREEAESTLAQKIAAWFRQPRHFGLLAVAAALAVAIFVWTGSPGTRLTVPLDPTRAPALSMLSVQSSEAPGVPQHDFSQLFQLSPKRRVTVRLGLNKPGNTPEYRIGEPIRIGLSIESDANCVLLDREGDLSVVRLFPNKFMSSTLVRGPQTVFVPPAGQGNMTVAGPPGLHEIRLIIFPPDVSPDALSTGSSTDKATVVTREYRVLGASGQ
ncbi:MAG: DUF4384 domain-containing protein [Terriglobia bacterium]